MSEKVLTFYLCGGLFGIDITLVKEINRNVEYTPVPEARPHIVGLFNMRGQVVTLFDLGKLMGYKENGEGQKATCIILKSSSNNPDQVGFLIDRCGDVVDITNEDREPLPANAGSIEEDFLSNVVKLEDELLMIIDPNRILRS